MEFNSLIKNKAKEIGFDLVGIASVEPFTKTFQLLKERQAKGQLSGFINKDLRLLTTPKLHLPNVKSIISLALSYASSDQFNVEEGYIALYARGKDYHQLMLEKMGSLINFMKGIEPKAEFKPFTDTGPLLDREIAYRAGLGWIGKNNNLINPYYGSFLVLGEILTDLDLEFDQKIKSRCGNCQRCLKNCPSGALKKPYYLEPEHCISNLTQKKGFLSQQDRKIMGNNLWGCDSCQLICPYNQKIPVDLHPEFKSKIRGNFNQVLNFTKTNLEKDWQNSALIWRGLRILKRNTLINIGNSGNIKYLSLLKRELTNLSPILRAYAVWALGEIGSKDCKDDLSHLYRNEQNIEVLKEIEEAFLKNKDWGDLND